MCIRDRDLTAKQIMGMRETLKSQVKFVLMNSFATSEDTMNFFKAKYPALYADPNLEFVQNKVPKIARDTLAPALWPAKPSVEWCPPGHGDLYAALLGSGKLDALLAGGAKYMFVSNSDNLGATMDVKLLRWFVSCKAPIAMEVARGDAAPVKTQRIDARREQVAAHLLLLQLSLLAVVCSHLCKLLRHLADGHIVRSQRAASRPCGAQRPYAALHSRP